jgi:hypothetical protein
MEQTQISTKGGSKNAEKFSLSFRVRMVLADECGSPIICNFHFQKFPPFLPSHFAQMEQIHFFEFLFIFDREWNFLHYGGSLVQTYSAKTSVWVWWLDSLNHRTFRSPFLAAKSNFVFNFSNSCLNQHTLNMLIVRKFDFGMSWFTVLVCRKWSNSLNFTILMFIDSIRSLIVNPSLLMNA